jgi:hypothetical protein
MLVVCGNTASHSAWQTICAPAPRTRRRSPPPFRAVFGLWADRFYTLRNHIIHGERVPLSEYRFRGAQHHVFAAAQIFGVAVKRLINESLKARGKPAVFDDRLRWVTGDADNEVEERYEGFQLVPDFELYAERYVGMFTT